MKKIIAVITGITVALLPLTTASSAQATTAKKTVTSSIGGYCC